VQNGDTRDVDAILGALYQTISGPPGPRDWDRLRSLFLPGAHIGPTRRKDGERSLARMSIDDFIAAATPRLLETAFYEREVAREEERFGAIAHAWSHYESRTTPDGAPFARGANSIQLFDDGARWWIANLIWDDSALP